jgi:type I restriction-modification system DNA methylase subunit
LKCRKASGNAIEAGTHFSNEAGQGTRIINTYHAWRGEENLDGYQDMPGFCKSVSVDTIAFEEYSLSPERYVEPIAIGDRLMR